MHPHANALTEAGQSSRFSDRPSSRAIVGRLTTRIPDIMELISVMQATVPIMTVALHLDNVEVFPLARGSLISSSAGVCGA